jgi:outer membrane protein OmpA-like peptidoglycan-associated protein
MLSKTNLRLFVCGVAVVWTLAADPKKDKDIEPVNPAAKALQAMDAKEIKLGEDEPGCKDSALLPRLAGCNVIQCTVKDFDSVELLVPGADKNDAQREVADGASEILYYLCPGKLKPDSIVKQTEATLSKSGFETLFDGKDADEFPVLTTRREDQLIQISTYVYNNYSAYVFTALKLAPDPATTSEAIDEALKASGRVILGGVDFEPEKTDANADSEKVFAEIVELLRGQADLKIRIEVHTDNIEGPKTSLELSEKRAASVANWLAAHGVDKARLTTQGFGSDKPIADNNTDEGRARNRRIELVKVM